MPTSPPTIWGSHLLFVLVNNTVFIAQAIFGWLRG